MAVNYATAPVMQSGSVAYFDSKRGLSTVLSSADPLVPKNNAFIDSGSNQTYYDIGVSNRYYHTDSTPDTLEGNSNFTVCGVFRRTDIFAQKGCWGIGGDTNTQGVCSWNSSNTSQITIDLWGSATFSSGQTYPENEWCFAAWTKAAGAFSRSNCAIWKNTVKYTGSDLSVVRGSESQPVNINNNGLSVGSINDSNGYVCPIEIGFIIFYDRVLTDTEILKNFNFTKSRGYI
jgi:hypothetical protein